MAQIAKTLETRRNSDSTYVIVVFDIGIVFGNTELKAFIQWEENVRARNLANTTPFDVCLPALQSLTVCISLTGCQEARARNYYTQCTSLSPFFRMIGRRRISPREHVKSVSFSNTV